MYGKIPDCCRKLPAGPAAQLRRTACTLTGAAVLATCVLATTAAAPAAVHRAGHGSRATAVPTIRHTSHASAAAAIPAWIHIATGGFHTCGIREGNTLWCWGDARFGDLGTGPAADQVLPQQITKPTAGWVSVTAGHWHSCATRSDGTLWCWGDNSNGDLGIGTTTSVDRPDQVTTPAATGWASVAGGYYHTCATRTDGTLWCWGNNFDGQLGIGTTTGQDLPQQVTTPAATGWATVTTGAFHTCAARTDTTLWCWGLNDSGQLGTGTTVDQDLPQQVTTPAATGWATVTTGDSHTCAARTDTTLWCWGLNDSGQLGIGTTVDQDLPQQVTTPATTGWATVTAGSDTTCALRTHALRCWGANFSGELGIGNSTSQDLPRRVLMPTSTGWSSLATGDSHTCATHTGHTLWCWGGNYYGELGIGTTVSQALPQQVTS